jgi:2-polyprenyl-3-methyl-5-hydroxy-6-metoxy-1,4-benzoquinol methylase
VSGWLSDKQYIISTSVQEGCPYNVLEAAASGLKPVIHNFYGAEGLFPPEWLFNSTAEFVDAVLDPNFDSTKYRKVVVEQYEHEKQVREIEKLLQPLRRSRMPALPVSIPAHPGGGDGQAGLIEPESVQPSANTHWVALDDRYAPYISGREFHNGLRISVDAQDGDVPARPDFLTAIATGMKVIDLGCTDHAPLIEQKLAQDNWVHKRLSEVADRCIGVDIDPTGIEAARSFGYDVLHLDIIEDAVPADIENHHWDFLVVGEVLEHIGDPVAFLSTIRAKYCDYVDRIVVTVPNALRIANFQFAKQGLEVVNSDHRFWFTPYTLAKIMTDAGLVIEGYRMLQSNPVTDPNARSFLLQNPLFREGVAMVARLSV